MYFIRYVYIAIKSFNQPKKTTYIYVCVNSNVVYLKNKLFTKYMLFYIWVVLKK